MESERSDFLAEVSTELLSAIGKAEELADRGDLGTEFRDLVQHAKSMHTVLLQELTALPDASDFKRGLARTYGAKLDALVKLVDDPTRP
ncbi:MAG: hypothetical protein ABI607_06700 [Betaproteobacteria bacterium]